MSPQVATKFPGYKERVQELVKDHLTMKDEPLLLAIYYAPERDPQDIFLFEVISGFGSESENEDLDLFEVTYSSAPLFSIGPESDSQTYPQLHLIMTSPEELKTALQEKWPLADEIRKAGDGPDTHQVLYSAREGDRLLELIRE